MASGREHYEYWKLLSPVTVPVAAWIWVASKDPIIPASIVAGYLMGAIIDPDLDLVGITNAESRAMRHLKIFGVILTMWFLPYAYFMRFIGIGKKGHRNFFSHMPGISTVIRLLWLFAPFLLFGYFKHGYIPGELEISIFIGLWIGLTFSDTVHYVADVI